VTSKPRKVFADELLIGVSVPDLRKITGGVADALNADLHTAYPKSVQAMTVTIKWHKNTANADWFNVISDDLWGSFRRIDADSLMNRLELLNTPVHRNGDLHAIRVAYNDFNQQQNWIQAMQLDNPTGAVINPDVGYPKNGHVYNQSRAMITEAFLAAQNALVVIDPADIPAIDHVYIDVEPYSWFYGRPGQGYNWSQVRDWAARPIAADTKLALIHGSFSYLLSGWASSAINMTRIALSSVFPTKTPLKRYADTYHVNGTLKTCGINAHGEAGVDCVGGKPDWTDNWRYTFSDYTTDMDTQYDYANGLPNEHFPPYSNTQKIQWQGDASCTTGNNCVSFM